MRKTKQTAMGCWKFIAGDFAVQVIGVHKGQVAKVVNLDGTVSRVVLGNKVGKHLYRSRFLLSRGKAPTQSGKVLVKNGADVSLPCKLPWANGRTAEGLAELEGQHAALAYLRSVRAG